MSHVRTQLRDQIVTYVTNLATTGPNVFKGMKERVVVEGGALPALLVYFEPGGTEQAEYDTIDTIRLNRECRIVVKGVVKEVQPEDTLNQIAAEVETAVLRQLASLAIDCMPAETRFVYGSDMANADIAAVEIVFAILYRTVLNSPETAV